MHKIMYQLVLVLAILILSNSACRVKGECTGGCRIPNRVCTEDGLDCIADDECCTGYCDWRLSYYPFSGGCAPRPSGPLPFKPCIPLHSGEPCYYNETCCEGYCETRYPPEGFCIIELPPGFGLPPSYPPSPVATEIAPISAPTATDLSPISSPIATPVTPSASPVPSDLAPSLSPGSAIIPPYDVPVPAPTPARSKTDGRKKKPVAPTKAPSKKDGRKIKLKKKDKSGSLRCRKAHAPTPAY